MLQIDMLIQIGNICMADEIKDTIADRFRGPGGEISGVKEEQGWKDADGTTFCIPDTSSA